MLIVYLFCGAAGGDAVREDLERGQCVGPMDARVRDGDAILPPLSKSVFVLSHQ